MAMCQTKRGGDDDLQSIGKVSVLLHCTLVSHNLHGNDLWGTSNRPQLLCVLIAPSLSSLSSPLFPPGKKT